MKAFLKKWLLQALKDLLAEYIPILLILIFAMIAITYWPGYAFISIAIFAIAVIVITVRLL